MQATQQQVPPHLHNDALKLENYERLLHQCARACYGRLREAKVTIDYIDVYQEMGLSYAKAVRGFDPSRGFAFSTYLVRTCYQEFNRSHEKVIAEKVKHGVMSAEDLKPADHEGGDMDFFAAVPDTELNPEEALSHKQQIKIRMRCLSDDGKRVLTEFLRPSPALHRAFAERQQECQVRRDNGSPNVRVPTEITIGFIGKFLDMDRNRIASVREELERIEELAN